MRQWSVMECNGYLTLVCVIVIIHTQGCMHDFQNIKAWKGFKKSAKASNTIVNVGNLSKCGLTENVSVLTF